MKYLQKKMTQEIRMEEQFEKIIGSRNLGQDDDAQKAY